MYLSKVCRMRWSRMMSEAEKLVGYTGSFLSLQYLLTDEMAQVALSVRKLMSSKHPLFKTAKHLINDGNNAVQTYGLTVLLVSRLANSTLSKKVQDFPVDGIFSAQRSLAEITELIFTANLIHRGILNAEEIDSGNRQNLTMGNKLGVLGGDFLLATASTALAKLQNPQVVNNVAQAIADMTEAEFVDEPKSVEEWEHKVYLSCGSLLAHGCRSSLQLVEHSDEFKLSAFEFGKNLTSVLFINRALNQLKSNSNDDSVLSDSIRLPSTVDANSLRDVLYIRASTATANLETFENSDSKSFLQNIVHGLANI